MATAPELPCSCKSSGSFSFLAAFEFIDVRSLYIHAGAMAENGKGEETKVQFSDGLLFRVRCKTGEDTPKILNRCLHRWTIVLRMYLSWIAADDGVSQSSASSNFFIGK